MSWTVRNELKAVVLGIGIASCGGVETQASPSAMAPGDKSPIQRAGEVKGFSVADRLGRVKKLGAGAETLEVRAPAIEESLARLAALDLVEVGRPISSVTKETCLPYRECTTQRVELQPAEVAKRVASLADIAEKVVASVDASEACPGFNGCWALDTDSIADSIETLNALEIVELGAFAEEPRPEDAACYFSCCPNDQLNCEKTESLRQLAAAVEELR